MAKSTANRKKRRSSPSVEVCTYCTVAFIAGKNEPRWVACDTCDAWYHVKCTDLSPSLSREEVETLQWFCRNCISMEKFLFVFLLVMDAIANARSFFALG